MGDSFERDVARAVNPTLMEYRLGQLENKVRDMGHRMDSLATRTDVEGINQKLDEAARASTRAASLRAEHTFSWRSTLFAGAGAGIIAGIVVIVFTTLANRIH